MHTVKSNCRCTTSRNYWWYYWLNKTISSCGISLNENLSISYAQWSKIKAAVGGTNVTVESTGMPSYTMGSATIVVQQTNKITQVVQLQLQQMKKELKL